MDKSRAEIKHNTQIAGLSNDLEKIQLVEEREEIYKKGDAKSKIAAVDEDQKDVRMRSFEKEKSKQGKFFQRGIFCRNKSYLAKLKTFSKMMKRTMVE